MTPIASRTKPGRRRRWRAESCGSAVAVPDEVQGSGGKAPFAPNLGSGAVNLVHCAPASEQ